MRKGLVILILACLFCVSGKALGVSASSAILVDAASGKVLYEKSADVRRPIASVTKLMTAYAASRKGSLDRVVSVTGEDIAVEGSSMYLRAGQKLTMRELLSGMLVTSGNDAARAAARLTSGGEDAFAELMNRCAASLGMNSTAFENASGLDGVDNRSTARDVSRLMLAVASDPVTRELAGIRTLSVGGQSYRNHNKLLWLVDGAECGKTGFTKLAGRCLASTAVRGGRRLAAVTLSAPDDWNDHAALYEYGFSQFSDAQVCAAGQLYAELPVVGAPRAFASVSLLASERLTVKLLPGESVKAVIYSDRFAYYPALPGEKAGSVGFFTGDYKLGEVGLVYG